MKVKDKLTATVLSLSGEGEGGEVEVESPSRSPTRRRGSLPAPPPALKADAQPALSESFKDRRRQSSGSKGAESSRKEAGSSGSSFKGGRKVSTDAGSKQSLKPPRPLKRAATTVL